MSSAWNRFSKRMSATLRQQLAARSRRPLPAGGDLLWTWFAELSAARAYNAAGPVPIAFADIEAYFRLTGWPAAPRHIAVLRSMDGAFLDHAAEVRASVLNNTMPSARRQKLTAAAFDAVFG